MEGNLQTLVILYAGILFSNAVFAAFFWYKNRLEHYKILTAVWAFAFINFLLMGTTADRPDPNGQDSFIIVISSTFGIFFSLALARLIALSSSIRMRILPYLLFQLLGVAVSFFIYQYTTHFIYVAFPTALTTVFPILALPVRVIFTRYKKLSSMTRGMSITSFLLGVHHLDFPIFRPMPEFAPYGFTIVVLIIFLLSVFSSGVVLEVLTDLKARNRELEHLNVQKNTLFSLLAHDLRNPVWGIISVSEEIIHSYDSYSDDYKLNYIKEVHSSTSKLYDVLNNLLKWVSLQSDRVLFSPAQLNLDRETNAAVEYLKNQAEKKQISINIEIAPDLHVFADRQMLHAIIRNLVSNAVKFSQARKSVTVSAAASGHHVTVEVTDQGAGMSELKQKMLKSINETNVFQAGPNKGLGLGLLFCNDFLKQHDSQLNIESETGKGTRVFFTLRSDKYNS